jgi:DNA-binding Xre family transcriptional regulator
MPRGGVTVRWNIDNLKLKLQVHTGRAITWDEIADAADLSKNTLVNLNRNKTRRVDFDTLESLLAYFRSQGMEVGVGDLIVMEIA